MGKVHLIIDQAKNLSRLFVEEVVQSIEEAKRDGTKARIGLSGGSVAEVFLPELAKSPIEVERLEVFFCDERAVPSTDRDSNFRRANELWLSPAAIPQSQLFPMTFESSLADAAMRYEDELKKRAGAPLDLVLLGVGPDGHIASLFPRSASLTSEKWVEPVFDSPKPPSERLTMTIHLLAQSRRIVVAAFGASKAEAIKRALGEESELPLSVLLKRAPQSLLLLDSEAAGSLGENGANDSWLLIRQ